MGTLLSLPPGCRSAAAALKEPPEVPDDEEEKKRRSVLLQALRCRKRLAALGSRGKSAPEGPKVRARPRQEEQMCIRRLVVQASTGELLRCLSDFLRRRCVKLKEFPSSRIVVWLRNVERALLLQGWQHQGFLSPASLVFVYLLCRDAVDEDTASEQELHATFLTCLYLAYCYLGNEISYPMKPFLVESSRDVFWERALEVIERLSADMLRLNAEPRFFTEVFQDLKRHSGGGGCSSSGGGGCSSGGGGCSSGGSGSSSGGSGSSSGGSGSSSGGGCSSSGGGGSSSGGGCSSSGGGGSCGSGSDGNSSSTQRMADQRIDDLD